MVKTEGSVAKKNTFIPVQDLAGNIVEVPIEEPNITMEVTEIKKRGRPKKYATAEEARKAKIANTIASAKRRKEESGKGLFSSFNKKIEGAVQKVKDTGLAIVYGRNDYPPKVRKIISQYGDKIITGINLGRTPLGKPLMTALQLASGNTFSQKLENTPYDKLFHLFACIELGSSSKIILEKNEVINTENNCKLPKETESRVITSSSIPSGLTLNDALNNTKERMGSNFFTYSAKDNNCQDFIVAFLTANNIGDETDKSWVKQETKVLFEGNDRLRKIANTLTDIGARVDVLKQGTGVGGKSRLQQVIDFEDMKWGSFSKQLQAYNSQHKKKLDLHNFAMMILANPKKFQKRTKKRARFYINVILKKGGMIDEESIGLNPVIPLTPTRKRKIVVYELIKSPVNNIDMANSWINYVKAYAKKNNMKYNDALKDPACKAGYKKGGKFDLLKSITDVGTKLGQPYKETVGINPFTVGYDLGHDVIGPALMKGRGMPTSRDAYISELYDQANLGANGRVRLGKK